MGVINLTSDSFYQSSRKNTLKEVIEFAEKSVFDGADIIDIGAESSRPYSKPISEEIEIKRLKEIIPELVQRLPIPISVDTYKPKVAEFVLNKGVSIINNIAGLKESNEIANITAKYDAGIILMHMQGNPQTMQKRPYYRNLITEIESFLKNSADKALKAGINSTKISLDPGIGFGKTIDHNLKIIRELNKFKSLKFPLTIGISRKSFIGKILDLPVEERLEGSIAATVLALNKGAKIFRVHDVKETIRAIRVADKIKNK